MGTGNLEVRDDLGDVGVHLVKLGVLGGRLPVLATGHSVHDVLSEKGITISTYIYLQVKGDNIKYDILIAV